MSHDLDPKSMVQGLYKNAFFVPKSHFLREKFNLKITCDLNICSDLDLWSFVRVQNHWQNNRAPISFQYMETCVIIQGRSGGTICEVSYFMLITRNT